MSFSPPGRSTETEAERQPVSDYRRWELFLDLTSPWPNIHTHTHTVNIISSVFLFQALFPSVIHSQANMKSGARWGKGWMWEEEGAGLLMRGRLLASTAKGCYLEPKWRSFIKNKHYSPDFLYGWKQTVTLYYWWWWECSRHINKQTWWQSLAGFDGSQRSTFKHPHRN